MSKFAKRLTLQQVQDAIRSQAPSDAPRMPAFMDQKPRVRQATRNAHPEADIQAAISLYLHKAHPHILVSASLSGTALKGGMFAMQRHKRQGGTTGWPDLTLILPLGRVIFLEVKSEKGTLSEAQKYIHGKLTALGHSIYVVRSIDDVMAILIK